MIAGLLTALALLFGCTNHSTPGANGSIGPTYSPYASANTGASPIASLAASSVAVTASPSPIATPNPEATPSPSTSLIGQLEQQINKLTLKEKIGQLVLVGMEGTIAGEDDRNLIQSRKVGGIIFFKPNLINKGQTVKLINDLKQLNLNNPIPLWLSVDEEGGRVTRLPAEFAKLPTSQSIGLVNNLSYSRQVGSLIGQELHSVGMNMDFAPVMDVNSNPNNPVIGDRSFGDQPDIVSRLGIQTMKGLQSENVASVIKHFPGHGDTSVDSHIGLPVVQHDLDRLRSLELIPYARAIEQGADAIMVAHILLPKLDDNHPASFSKPIITGLLREELGFDGVVMTDDMTMGAVAEHYNLGDAAVHSILAGADIVLVCHDYAKENAVLSALTKAVSDGRITEKRLNESVMRILLLKNKYEVNGSKVNVPDLTQLNTKIHDLVQQYQ
ncbi:MAG: beta-N-acetylhexosaminidase [Gorillibacterium sp.]|nr:beta-N-acetylhexosaminidase [Gorillibacterium sp.]